MWIYAWNEASAGAKALADGLDAKRIRHTESKFRGRPNRTVLNWGASRLPEETAVCRVLNPALPVLRASNKLMFFQTMSVPGGPRVPEWTTDPTDALDWHNKGHEVVGRRTVTGHSGEGIVFFSENDIDDLMSLPLYTKYKKKKEEFRVHFVRGKVVDVQKKLLRTTDDAGNKIDPKTIDFRVRNLSNGFVFGRNDIRVHDDVIEQATKAFNLSGLDFGAIDVIFSKNEQKAYVLEINTAPGLQGTTLTNYINELRKI